MRFREHRGGLAEAMATVVEIEPTKQAICDHLNSLRLLGVATVKPKMLTISQAGFDKRVDWHTCWVHVRGAGMVGCIDHATGDLP